VDKQEISMRDYVDTRFEAQNKAVELALETVKEAMKRDDRRVSNLLSIVAIIVSVAFGVWTIARHV